MAQHEMTHPTYGTRVVEDRQVDSYLNTGWTQDGEVTPDVVDGPVRAILDAVGDDRGRALEALTAEQSRPSPRSSLVTALARIAEPADTTSEV